MTEFARIGARNPIIRYFFEADKQLRQDGFLLYDGIANLLRKTKIKNNKRRKRFLEEVKFQMSLFKAKACVAGFFRQDLIGVLFLGDKLGKAKFSAEELGFLSVLASDVVMAIQNAWLFEDLRAQAARELHVAVLLRREPATVLAIIGSEGSLG